MQFGVDLWVVKPDDPLIFKLNVSIPLVNKYKVNSFIFSIKSYFRKKHSSLVCLGRWSSWIRPFHRTNPCIHVQKMMDLLTTARLITKWWYMLQLISTKEE